MEYLIINTELKWKIYKVKKKQKIFITLNYPQMKMWMEKTLLLKNQKSRYSENFIQSHFYSEKVFFVHTFVCRYKHVYDESGRLCYIYRCQLIFILWVYMHIKTLCSTYTIDILQHNVSEEK